MNRCCECRKGEHDDYDDNVVLIVMRNPDNPGRLVIRGRVCEEHREAFEADGYAVEEIK